MAKKTVSKIENQVKTINDAAAVENATSIRAVTLLMDKATIEVDKKKDALYGLLKSQFAESLIGDEATAFGNFQIPVGDQGDIVEFPVSCTPEPLDANELQNLEQLPAAIFQAIFEEVEEIDSISDISLVMAALASHSNLGKFAAVKGGKVVISCADTTLPGVTTKKSWYAKNTFVARLHQAIANNPHTDEDVKRIVDWFTDRMRLAIKIGNRASTTTT